MRKQRSHNRFSTKYAERKRWQKSIVVLAVVVAFSTAYILMRPATTLTRQTYCGQEEHTHSQKCYTEELVCGQEESDEHTHDASCYDTVLTCDKEEHTHDADCFADSDADEQIGEVEEDVEEPSAPESEEESDDDSLNVQSITLYANTLTAEGDDYTVTLNFDEAAQIPDNAELSVQEITDEKRYKNYQVQAKSALEEKQGKNLQMTFARFFAMNILADGKEITPAAPVEVKVQYKNKVERSDTALSTAVYFAEDGVEIPDTETNDGEKADEFVFAQEECSVVGTVVAVEADETENTVAVDAEADKDKEPTAETDAEENPKEEVVETASEDKTYSADADGVHVEVEAPADAFDSEVDLMLSTGDLSDKEQALLDAKHIQSVTAMHIHFEDAEKNNVEPNGSVKVNLSVPKSMLENRSYEIYHIVNGNVETVASFDAAVSQNGRKKAAGKNAAGNQLTTSFTTDSFSTYVVGYTVDFAYSVNGKMFNFSLPGGEKIALSDLIEVLGIIEGTQYGDVDEFIEHVSDVEFSNPELVSVEHKTPVLGVFGEEDWVLESLQPFDTTEELTIIMDDGSVVTVVVTDAQGTALNEMVSDATLEINGQTYGEGDTWKVLPNVDYQMTLTFTEIGSRQFGTGGTTAVMDMPAGLTLKEGETGYFDIPAGLAGTITGNKFEVKNGKLYITFGDDPDDILTRASDAHFNLTLTAKFSEDADELKFNDRVTRDVDIDTNADVSINKTGSYNQTTGKMDYVVTITSYGNTKNIAVSDSISGSILSLESSSIRVEPDGKELSQAISTSGNSFNLKIKEMAHNETVTIKYSANVNINDELKNKGYKLTTDDKNTVTVTPEGGDPHTQDYVYPNEINYSNIAKSNTETEDSDDKTVLTWTIVANNPATGSVAGGKITDRIGWNSKDAMTYQVGADGKLALSIIVTDENGNKTTRDLSVSVQTDEWTGQQTWEYEIPETDGKYSYEITYKTVVDKEKLGSNSNGIVTNEVSVDHGGSTGGTGVVPGVTPGGGGGDDTNPIIAGKTASTVTEEYIDWDIVVFIPADKDYTGGFTITDEIPWHYGAGDIGAVVDTIDTSFGNKGVEVVGLSGNETFDVEITETNDRYLRDGDGNSILRQIAKITFYQDAAKTDKGLDKSSSARTLTIKVRTKNSDYWMWAASQNTEFSKHTNTANINNEVTVSGDGQPMLSTVIKKGTESEKPGWANGSDDDIYFKYDVQITNVTELPLTITDTFDSEYLEFVDPTGLPEGTDLQTIYIEGGEMSYSNMTSSSNGTATEGPYVPSFSVSGNTLTITVNDLFKKTDGTYYPYYHIRYYLRVKSNKLDELKQKAVENKGTYKLGNTAVWGSVSDHTDVEYTVPTLEKDGWFRDSVNSRGNNRLFDFMIDINPEAIQLNGGADLTLSDNHTSNLTVDYTTVKIYKITDESVTSAQMKEAIQILSKKDSGVTLESWEQERLDAIAGKYTIDNTVDWDFSSNSSTFTGLKDSTHYVIAYSALIIGSGSQSFSNEAEMNGFYSTKTGSRDFGNDSDAGANVYQIQLLKHEYGKTSNGLQGATFQLFVDDGNGNPVPMYYGDTIYTRGTYDDSYPDEYKNFVGFNADHENLVGEPITFTTNDSGYTLIALNQVIHGSQLEEGVHYYLKEVESPAGYKIDSSVEYWSFTLTKDPDEVNYGGRDAYGNRQWIYFYYDDILKMSNTKITENETLTVKADKVWRNADGTEMSDTEKASLSATVQLYRKMDDGDYAKVKVTRSGDTVAIEEVTDDSGLVTLDSSNDWSYDWGELPRSDADHTYAYKLEETELTGFVSSVTSEEKSDDDGNVTLTFTAANQKTVDDYPTYGNLTVKKQWLEEDGTTEKIETKDVRFTLYRVVSRTPFTTQPTAGGSPYQVTSVDSKFKYDIENGIYKISKEDYAEGVAFSNLVTAERDKDGVLYFYAYYIKEAAIDGYNQTLVTTTDISGNTTFTMKNTEIPKPKTTSLKVDKKWQFEDADGNITTIDPPSDGSYVQFRLFQVKSSTPFADVTKISSGGTRYDAKDEWGGDLWFREDVGTYEIGKNWYWATREFPNLPSVTVDSNGKATYYAYYVKEIGLDDNIEDTYTITKNEDGSFKILMTNTKKPEETELEVSKEWTVNGEAYNVDGKTWPEGVQVEVTLYRNGAVVQDGEEGIEVNRTLILNAENISGKFENLPKEDADGNEYVYTIKEELQNTSGEAITTIDGKGNEAKITATDNGYLITNNLTTPGKLIVTKSFAGEDVLTEAEKQAIKFTVSGPDGFTEVSKTLGDSGFAYDSETGKYTWTIDNLEIFGDYTIKETKSDGTVLDSTVTKGDVTYTRTTTVSVDGSKVGNSDNTTVSVDSKDKSVAYVNKYTKPSDGSGTINVEKTWGTGVDKTPVSVSLFYKLIDPPSSGNGDSKTVHYKMNVFTGNHSGQVDSEEKTLSVKAGDTVQIKLTVSGTGASDFNLYDQSYNGTSPDLNSVNKTISINTEKTFTVTVPNLTWTNDYYWYFGGDANDGTVTSVSIAATDQSSSGGDDTTEINIDASLATKATDGIPVAQYQNVTIDSTTNWKTTFTNLPIKNADGKLYSYYVVENGGEAYGATYSQNDATDTITVNNPNGPETTSLNVKKVWKDQNGNDISSSYTGSADFELWQVKTTKNSSSGTGTNTVKIQIDAGSLSGVGTLGNDIVIQYRVYTSNKADVRAQLNSNVRLYANYYSGENFDSPNGYKDEQHHPTIEQEFDDGFILKYVIPTQPSGLSFTPKSIKLTSYSWQSISSWEIYGTPDLASGATIETETTSESVYQTFTLSNADTDWTKSFTNLPLKSADGKTTYQYYVKEINNPDDITVVYSPSGTGHSGNATSGTVTVTNTVTVPNTVSVSAKKEWNDNDSTLTYHPQVTFTLYRKALEEGESAPTGDAIPKTATEAREAGYSVVVENDDDFYAVKTIAVGTENTSENMTVSWAGLPEKDSDDQTYSYIVIENRISNYSLESVAVASGTFDYTVTNQLNEEDTKLTVNKVWNLNGQIVEDTSDSAKYPEVTFQVWQVIYTDAARTTLKPETTSDGTQYTTGVTGKLNKDNSWTEAINNLPKMRITDIAADGTVTAEYYSYYVTENPIPNADGDEYIVSYKAGNGPSQSTASDAWVGATEEGTIAITNGKYSIDVNVLKTDPDGSPLTGATFKIQMVDTNGIWTNVYADQKTGDDSKPLQGYYKVSDSATNLEFAVGADGKLHIENLSNGTYRFEEVKAPDGYVITEKYPASFVIKDGKITPQSSSTARYESSDSTFIVPNTPGVALPSTGGIGTTIHYVLGSILIAFAGAVLIWRRKRYMA